MLVQKAPGTSRTKGVGLVAQIHSLWIEAHQAAVGREPEGALVVGMDAQDILSCCFGQTFCKRFHFVTENQYVNRCRADVLEHFCKKMMISVPSSLVVQWNKK